jgi:hypothetical protein
MMRELMSFIIQSFFLGFGILMIILTVLKVFKSSKIRKFSDDLSNTSIIIIRITGIVYFQYFLICLIRSYADSTPLFKRITEQYWWSVWALILTYPILTQLYWFKQVSKSTFLRTIVALMILMAVTVFSDRLTILFTDIYRSYIHSYSVIEFTIEGLERFGLFALIVLVTHVIRKLQKKNIA